MKSRRGFISNSSSSSFIINEGFRPLNEDEIYIEELKAILDPSHRIRKFKGIEELMPKMAGGIKENGK